MKKITFGLVIINFLIFIGLLIFPQTVVSSKADHISKTRQPYMNIIASNKPAYLMIKGLVKDRHNVEFLLKSQEEIKNFKFTEDTVNNISKMNLFVYTSVVFEPWTESLINKLDKSKTGIIDLSRGTKSMVDSSGNQIPYCLMDFENYKIALFNMKNELEIDDYNSKSFYEDNYNAVIKKFEDNNLKNLQAIKSIESVDFYFAEYSVEYYAQYLNSKSVFLDQSAFDKIIKSKKDTKPFVVFYSDEKAIELSKAALAAKGAVFIKTTVYDENKEYSDLLGENITNAYNSLKSAGIIAKQ